MGEVWEIECSCSGGRKEMGKEMQKRLRDSSWRVLPTDRMGNGVGGWKRKVDGTVDTMHGV